MTKGSIELARRKISGMRLAVLCLPFLLQTPLLLAENQSPAKVVGWGDAPSGSDESRANYVALESAIESSEYINLRQIRWCRNQGSEGIVWLRQLLSRFEKSNPAAAVKTAAVLLRVDPNAGEPLLSFVKHPDSHIRLAALNALRTWSLSHAMSPEQIEVSQRAINDPDPRIRMVARDICASIPEVRPLLIESLGKLESEERLRLLKDLSHERTLEPEQADSVLAVILEELGKSPEQEGLLGIAADAYAYFGAAANKETREKFLSTINAIFETSERPSIFDQSIVHSFVRGADETSLPALKRIREQTRDSVARGYAFVALARIEGDKLLPEALAMIEKTKDRRVGYEALEAMTNSTNSARITALLIERFARVKDYSLSSFLLRHGGESGAQFLARHIDEFSPMEQMRIAWGINRWKSADVLAELRALGLVHKTPTPSELEEIRTNHEVDSFDLEIVIVRETISAAKFDAEADEIPVYYNELLSKFGAGTGGIFAPAQIGQTVREERDKIQYSVEFSYGSNRFRFRPEDKGDWVDINTLEAAVNQAMERSGQSERFIPLETDSQWASYAFGDPEKWKKAAAKYRIPLLKESSAPVRQGMEFERKVIQNLQDKRIELLPTE